MYLDPKYFFNSSKDIIFKEFFNNKYAPNELEVFYYFQSLINIIRRDKSQKNVDKIVKIMVSHKVDCNNDFCKCKLINMNYNKLDSLIQDIYNHLNFMRDRGINIIFSVECLSN